MSSTTVKHRNILEEPVGNKPVTTLPGVGDAYGVRLRAAGFESASKVVGQFLMLDKNKEAFQVWMNDTCHASRDRSEACYNCLNAKCEFI